MLTESSSFQARFGREPEAVFFSPGRVNLLGEHTDYNQGLVLPMAIGLGMQFDVAARADARFRITSDAYGETVELTEAQCLERAQCRENEGLPESDRGHWSDYLLGVLAALPWGWPAQGLDVLIRSDLPRGRGLSSSASLALGFAAILNERGSMGLDGLALAQLAQAAENDFVGVACGLLDPFAVAMGQAGHLVALHCGSLTWERVPLPADHLRVVLADTGVARTLAGSRYNERRRECERAAALAGRPLVELEAADFAPGAPLASDPVALKRARHVWSEHARVQEAMTQLRAGRPERLGPLMSASHRSLRDDYAVSCPELDTLAELLQAEDGVLGAKMTGAGFGGAVVALVEADGVEALLSAVPPRYASRAAREATLLVCQPADGFRRLA